MERSSYSGLGLSRIEFVLGCRSSHCCGLHLAIFRSLYLLYQAVIGHQPSSADEWNTQCDRGKTPIMVINVILLIAAVANEPPDKDGYPDQDRINKRILLWVIITDDLLDSFASYCIENP